MWLALTQENGGNVGQNYTQSEFFSISLLVSSTAPGVYTVSAAEGNAMSLFIAGDATAKVLQAGSGTITISSWDDNGRCTGLFSGNFIDPAAPTERPVEVTLGVFDVVFNP